MATCPFCKEPCAPDAPCPNCGAVAAEPVLLVSTADDEELRAAAAALDTAKVPYYTRDRESGNYMRFVTGRSLYGTELYVAKGDIRRARHALGFLMQTPYDEEDLLEAYDDFMEQQDEDALTEEEEARKDGGSYKTLGGFLIAFGVLILAAIVIGILR